jgi:hypothetical protein
MCVSGGRKGARAMTRGLQAADKGSSESLHGTAEMTFFRFTVLACYRYFLELLCC